MGDLYIVSTPIGNLEDITLRALRVLKEVVSVACEDTRRTRRLLSSYGIKTRMLSYHDHNKSSATRKILSILEEDGDVALVADAGTPAIADPGLYLVRAAIAAGVKIVPLPGASIILTSLVVSGLPTAPFYFHGFLPRREKSVTELCEEVCERGETLIFLDSPRRLARDLGVMTKVFGNREGVVAREVTKVYEDFRRGSLSALLDHYGAGESSGVRGEVAILVEGASAREIDTEEVLAYIRSRLEREEPTARDLCRDVMERFELGRNRSYRMIIAERKRKHQVED